MASRQYVGKRPVVVYPAQVRRITADAVAIVSDVGNFIFTEGGAAVSITVQPEGNLNYGEMGVLSFLQEGAGLLTVAAGAGVTIVPQPGQGLISAGQGSLIQLMRTAKNTWSAFGSLAAA